jgi:hypothetical protein
MSAEETFANPPAIVLKINGRLIDIAAPHTHAVNALFFQNSIRINFNQW